MVVYKPRMSKGPTPVYGTTSVAVTLQELAPHPAILVEVDEPLAVP